MALIQCPECQGKVSDSLHSCPHCGYVLRANRVTPPTPPTPAPAPSVTNVGLNSQELKCVHCGAPLAASDIVSSGWAHCSNCGTDVCLTGNNTNFSDGIIEKAFTFDFNKDDFHRVCMNKLMEVGEEDVFANITNIKATQHYVWVRAFGMGDAQEYYPMDSFGEELFDCFADKGKTMTKERFDELFPRESMVTFNSDVVRGTNLHAKEVSSSECKFNYLSEPDTSGKEATDFYFCLPFFEEVYEYNGKEYTFLGVVNHVVTSISWRDIPENAHIKKNGPKYTDAYPLMYTFIGLAIAVAVIIAGGIVIGAFAEGGFWGGLLILVLIGIVLAVVGWIAVAIIGVVGAAIAGLFALVDIPIQKSINARRRKKYRDEYERIQSRKQQDARTNLGLELEYTVPEFPIP